MTQPTRARCRIVVRGVVVDRTRCTRCMLCVELCPADALAADSEGYPVLRDAVRCMACVGCMAVCVPSAIRVTSEWVCEGM